MSEFLAKNTRIDFSVVKIRTAYTNADKDTGLSFFETENDIPFRITRMYAIYKSEENKQTGFHPHKQSWHLLFCPYGEIEVSIDTGSEKRTIKLDDPSVGLILHPNIWREIVWIDPESVLCVATSGHYEAEKLNSNYQDYLENLKARSLSANIESAEYTGKSMC